MTNSKMNYGIIIYKIVEVIVLLALSFFYFMMGRNKLKIYQKIREKLESMVPFFRGNLVYYLATFMLALIALVRIGELISIFNGEPTN